LRRIIVRSAATSSTVNRRVRRRRCAAEREIGAAWRVDDLDHAILPFPHEDSLRLLHATIRSFDDEMLAGCDRDRYVEWYLHTVEERVRRQLESGTVHVARSRIAAIGRSASIRDRTERTSAHDER